MNFKKRQMNKVKRFQLDTGYKKVYNYTFSGEYFGKLKLLVEESYRKEGRKVVLVKWQMQKIEYYCQVF